MESKSTYSEKGLFLILITAITSVILIIGGISMVSAQDPGALIPGKGWVKLENLCDGDSTPLQFIPKTPKDSDPLTLELKKYPRCVHCGMNRTMWHHSRHLVQYSDDLVVGTCSIRCLAVNLSLNLDRGVKKIWAADFGDKSKPAKLTDADQAAYLVGSSLKGTMSRTSKMAFSDKQTAQTIAKEKGGELASFDQAISVAYTDMARDTIMIRKNRAAKMKKMREKKAKQ